jgi:hypothetical protein
MRTIAFLVDALPVPGKDGVGRRHRRDLFQDLPAQFLPKLSEGSTITISQLHATVDLLAQDTILGFQVLVTPAKFRINGVRDMRE